MRVRAAPENGKANAAVRRLVAGYFDVPTGAVRVISGLASREKTLSLSGAAEALAHGLARLGAI